MNKNLFILFIILLTALPIKAQTSSGYTVAEEGAWCWFADPRAIHYENESGTINMSYIGYIDVHGAIKATQYNWLTGEKSDVLVRSFFQPDDHNNPTFLVLPDERVLIIYSRHTDEAAFYYRVSVKPGDITQLGEEKRLATANNTTYPSPFILSDDPTHWYLCWRGISWHPTIARLTLPDANDNVKFDWGPYQMVQSTGARPYAKYFSNGKDKLYVSYTTGHPDNESPNWLYFNVININGGGEPTLEDIKGNRLSTIKNGTFAVNKTADYKSKYPNTVIDAPGSGIRDWVWQIALDSKERPRVAMVRINSGKTQHEYYYARWTGTSWALTDICDGGAKFHPSNTEYCYSGGEALDPQNPNIMYVSKPTEGAHGKVHEIWKYTLDDNGKVTGNEQITKDSEKNNVRPYVLPNSEGSPLRLCWMNGDYQYWIVCKSYPMGYPTGIKCDYDFKPSNQKSEGWTWSGNITINSSSYTNQVLCTLGDITYGIDAQAYPYVKLGGKTYLSQSRLYTSDAWQNCPATTDGKSYESLLSTWNLTLTYKEETKQLTVYRNGLIDQVIEGLTASVPEGASTGCQTQQDILQLQEESALQSLYIPSSVVTDIVLPSKVNGQGITWTSSLPEVISPSGIFRSPSRNMVVTLTASTGRVTRHFTVLARKRDIQQNLLASYDFSDLKDKSGHGHDLTLKGSAKVNGVLDLTANTAAGFATNGYAIVPAAVMDSLRSYTILFEATPKSLTNAPRFYDFGRDSGNSLFCRANALSAGIKYAGGTTTLTNSSTVLATGKTCKIAVTFEAESKTTSIYVNGQLAASGTENQNEAYMIALQGACLRNYIGRTQWWDQSVASSNVDYVGTMDNFMIYNTTLTQQEVCKMQGITIEVEEKPYTTSFSNGNFESSYTVFSKPSNDRAIYQPKGWNITYDTKDTNDLTALKSGDLYYSNFFASKAKPTDAGANTLWIRQRWGASNLIYSQNVLLPEGDYTLSADVYANSLAGSNKANVFVADQKVSPTKADQWQKVSINFHSDGTHPLEMGLQALHSADEFICGFDNFTVEESSNDKSYLGDVYPDNQFTILDLVLLIHHLQGGIPVPFFDLEAADVNNDGKVNALDVQALQQKIIKK